MDPAPRVLLVATLAALLAAVPPPPARGERREEMAVAGADGGEVRYSTSPGRLVASWREVWPEFADQDPTPLVRIYGDGRVVVHQAVYMKRHGVYEMWLERHELDALLADLTPTLVAFDEGWVAGRKREAEAARAAAAAASGEPVVFEVADAEVSVFRLAVDSYRPPGAATRLALPAFERSWRALRFDAERHPDLTEIQDLMRVEGALRALAERPELVWVAPVAAVEP